MMSDARILATLIRCTANTFTQPKTRRDLAQRLRGIRNASGPKMARLALAELSARYLTDFAR